MLRFAPSSVESMSLNNLRLAILNYIVAKQLNEDLVIRIEDINKKKNIEGKDNEILEILSLFSIDYSRAVHQSDSLKYHQKMAMQLLTQKKAFSCFCGDEKLEELKQEAIKNNKPYKYDGFCETLSDEAVLEVNAPFTVRIKSFDKDVDSFIILNHDKSPTYNYACSIDDMLMDISTVIRSNEHEEDTAKQVHIRNLLSYDKEINYIHLPKVSSSINSSVKYFIDEGFLPSAIANYLVLLGNEVPSEIFTLEDAIKWFDIEKTSKEELLFDIEKLKEINKKHIESMDELRLSKILGFADLDIGKLAKIYLNEVSTIKELKNKIDIVFTSKDKLEGFEEEFLEIKECIKKAPFFETFEDLEKYIKDNTSLEDKSLSTPLRYILTGQKEGPLLSEIYPLIKNYLGEIAK
ncbi:glutamate--tRNA ligase [Poseidonibacter parvus]|uniref:Glutamate--tRNA ligase n=1 Tax=Poseidonibacter parvus TaxID=1850254 RepID=A0A1P8KM88_9BACT|nr:glutamate--tRNA ligase family protein [Poseidonibacter parvus]APW65680.1 glutamate--tRNA ligase [Poseidonibacter parvus]